MAVLAVASPGVLAIATAADAACYRLLKPNGWEYQTVCTNSGGGGGGGGGGAGNAAAAIGAAGAILGILGSMVDEAERNNAVENENAARDAAISRQQAAARQAYCNETWQRGWDAVNRAGNIDRDDPAAALQHYEEARAQFSRCGLNKAGRDLLRQRLDETRKRLAALTDDNRVSDAQRRYGGFNAYDSGGSNPFGEARPTARAPAAATRLNIQPLDVVNQAKKRCSYAKPDSAEFKACMQTQEARLIMAAEPEIRAVCAAGNDAPARERCAIQAYTRKLDQIAANPSGEENCYYDQRGRPCYPGGGAPAAEPAKPKAESLRERLRKALAEKRRQQGQSEDVPEAELAAAVKAEEAKATPASLPQQQVMQAPAGWNRDDPLQHYLYGRNSSSGGRNSGDLGAPQPGMTGLTPDERMQRQGECLRAGGTVDTCR